MNLTKKSNAPVFREPYSVSKVKFRGGGMPKMINHREVNEKYQRIVDKFNPLFSHIEQVKKFQLTSNSWLPVHSDGSEAELTPTLKLKRRVIQKNSATRLLSFTQNKIHKRNLIFRNFIIRPVICVFGPSQKMIYVQWNTFFNVPF